MKEIELPKEEVQNKKNWEAPKLICLNKGKTEGGNTLASAETTSNTSIASLS
jgi:hypothetical protein